MTPAKGWRDLILRIYWDGQEHPSVEAPVGDFFACGWGRYPRSTRWPSASTRAALSTATGRCRSAEMPASRWKIATTSTRWFTTRSITR